MKKPDIQTTRELFAAGRWTDFLLSLPYGLTDWEVENYKDALKLRVIANKIAKNGDRSFSIKFIKGSDTRIIIDVRGKKTESAL